MQKSVELADDVILHETAAGLRRNEADDLTLYVVSLFGVKNAAGEMLNGDALLVRRRGTGDMELLAAVLGCSEDQVPSLLTGSGTWFTRAITQIDGHRLRFEAS
jgi:ribosomal protein L27